jgi:DNA/RNA endonuclease YhcR with UshA esterase domain
VCLRPPQQVGIRASGKSTTASRAGSINTCQGDRGRCYQILEISKNAAINLKTESCPMKTLLRVIGLCVLATLSLSLPVPAQTPSVIPDTKAQRYIGQNVTVEGVVTAVATSRKGNTFIDFGGVYPNQTFTGWVPAGTSFASDTSPQLLQGKKVKVTGRIELYRGKPGIKIISKEQLVSE